MITLNSKAEKRYLSGHPWLFRSDLDIPPSLSAGWTEFQNRKGKVLGCGLYSPHSQIALRVLKDKPKTLDSNYFKTIIEQSLERRKNINLNSNAYRVVFGESDFIPSFVLDYYAGALSFQILSAGLEVYREPLLDAVEEIFSKDNANFTLVERNDVSVRKLEQLGESQGIVKGSQRMVIIEENDLKLEVDLLEGQKTGAFLDQRDNRILSGKLSHNKLKMLDACTYNGWFACHMAKNSKGHLIALDQSEKALQQVERNARLNQLQYIEVLCGNVFDYLKEADLQKTKFDLINLDPPAFVKSKGQMLQALRGYKEINLRALKLLEPNGLLITSSCSHHMGDTLFEEMLHHAALDAKRSVQIVYKGQQAPDHPALLGFPESKYLKCFVLRVV